MSHDIGSHIVTMSMISKKALIIRACAAKFRSHLVNICTGEGGSGPVASNFAGRLTRDKPFNARC